MQERSAEGGQALPDAILASHSYSVLVQRSQLHEQAHCPLHTQRKGGLRGRGHERFNFPRNSA